MLCLSAGEVGLEHVHNGLPLPQHLMHPLEQLVLRRQQALFLLRGVVYDPLHMIDTTDEPYLAPHACA